jgi:hypothetical protein
MQAHVRAPFSCCASLRPLARCQPTAVAAQPAAASSSRRTLLGAGVALLASSAAPTLAAPASASHFKSAAGLLYFDEKVGDGEEAVAGDTVKILYSAHALDATGARRAEACATKRLHTC